MFIWDFNKFILCCREQLGYLTYFYPQKSETSMNIVFLIQSKKSPDFLDGRIEAFIENIEVSITTAVTSILLNFSLHSVLIVVYGYFLHKTLY